MKWFGRKGSTDTGSLKLSQSDRERQSLTKIKDMCSIANESAEKTGLNPHGDESRAERHRFDSAKRMSIKLLDDITNVQERDDALVIIIELCMKANDLGTGIKLIKSVRNQTVRDQLLKEYPVDFY